jgi:predicted nuclease of predicted toxin-antitoxin system
LPALASPRLARRRGSNRRLAVRDQRVLITADKDFGELVFRQNRLHHGIVLLRLHGLGSAEKCALAVASVTEHGAEFEHSFAVLEKDRIRIRTRPS